MRRQRHRGELSITPFQPASNDESILRQFVRISRDGDETVLSVMVITWDGPLTHTPQSAWVKIRHVPSAKTYLKRLRRHALAHRRYFSICQECHERKPRGWMHNQNICQGCAQRLYYVIY